MSKAKIMNKIRQANKDNKFIQSNWAWLSDDMTVNFNCFGKKMLWIVTENYKLVLVNK